jgi:benzaldehyde dehydrogenase (NAD)
MTLFEPTIWHGKINISGWREGGGGSADSIEPATGQTLGTVGMASPDDVGDAAATAQEAQKAWAARRPEERAGVLRRAGMLWEKHAEEVQSWIIRESGGIQPKAELETHIAANECYEASALPSLPAGDMLTSNESRLSFARRRPAGVVGVIAPFNFPLILSIRAVAPALALGNAVLLKPDPRTAVSGGVSLMRIFEEAGLPEGLLALLPGEADIGTAIVEAPEVRVIAFTGSTAAGRKVGETAARHLKRAHLELGGKNAMIVLPGADLAKAASAAAFGSFMHQGQVCMTTGRHIVHEDLYEEFVAAVAEKARNLPVGDPTTGTVALGPIIDEKQLKRVDSIVQESVLAGARLVAGGTSNGPYYHPTVLADVDPNNKAWSEEIFGPVAPIARFSDIDEAVDLVNDNEYGLTVAILGDVGLAMQIAD